MYSNCYISVIYVYSMCTLCIYFCDCYVYSYACFLCIEARLVVYIIICIRLLFSFLTSACGSVAFLEFFVHG